MLDDCQDEEVVIACTYLLAIIIPQVSTQILRLKFKPVASSFGIILSNYHAQTPPVKSILSCMQVLLLAQDARTWAHNSQCTQLFRYILALTVDDRQKVRKRAHQVVKQIIMNPPPPTLYHPASSLSLDYAIKFMSFTTQGASRDERALQDVQIIYLLEFLRAILPVIILNSAQNDVILSKLRILAQDLLRLPAKSSGTGNILLTQRTFSVMSCFFGKPIDVSAASDEQSIVQVHTFSIDLKRNLSLQSQT